MRWARRSDASAFVLLLVLPSSVLAADRDAMRTQAAQIAVLAELAPLTCSGIQADDAAVLAFMGRVKISQRDLSTRYKAATVAMLKTLKASTDNDRDAACVEILQRLGRNGLGLVREDDGAP